MQWSIIGFYAIKIQSNLCKISIHVHSRYFWFIIGGFVCNTVYILYYIFYISFVHVLAIWRKMPLGFSYFLADERCSSKTSTSSFWRQTTPSEIYSTLVTWLQLPTATDMSDKSLNTLAIMVEENTHIYYIHI